jgi:hypothetical protein
MSALKRNKRSNRVLYASRPHGIGHDDDFALAQARDIELLADAGAHAVMTGVSLAYSVNLVSAPFLQ